MPNSGRVAKCGRETSTIFDMLLEGPPEIRNYIADEFMCYACIHRLWDDEADLGAAQES